MATGSVERYGQCSITPRVRPGEHGDAPLAAQERRVRVGRDGRRQALRGLHHPAQWRREILS